MAAAATRRTFRRPPSGAVIFLVLLLFAPMAAAAPALAEHEWSYTVRLVLAEDCGLNMDGASVPVEPPGPGDCGAALRTLESVLEQGEQKGRGTLQHLVGLNKPPVPIPGAPAPAEGQGGYHSVTLTFWATTAFSCAAPSAPTRVHVVYETGDSRFEGESPGEDGLPLLEEISCAGEEGWRIYAGLIFLLSPRPVASTPVASTPVGPPLPGPLAPPPEGESAVAAESPGAEPARLGDTTEEGTLAARAGDPLTGGDATDAAVTAEWQSSGGLEAGATLAAGDTPGPGPAASPQAAQGDTPGPDPAPAPSPAREPPRGSLPRAVVPPPVGLHPAGAPVVFESPSPPAFRSVDTAPVVAAGEEATEPGALGAAFVRLTVAAAAGTLLLLGALSLYHRVLSRGRLAEGGVRGGILNHLAEAGPARLSGLARRLAVDRTTVQYHLHLLEKARLVSRTVMDKAVWYHLPADSRARALDGPSVALHDPAVREILAAVAAMGEADCRALAARTGRSPQGLHYHLSRLVRLGLVALRSDGGAARYRVGVDLSGSQKKAGDEPHLGGFPSASP